MNIRRLYPIVTVSAILALAGCAMPNVFKLSKDDVPKAGPRNPVIRILGMWEPAEGMLKGKSTRGFSSNIMFFSQNSDLAAEVEGDVVIYVFDDQGTAEDQAIPFAEYRIEAAVLSNHMGRGPLGATYAIFVPYTRPGIHEAKCALRLRFTPKGGQPVYSGMMNVVLPGEKKHKDTAAPEEGDDGTTTEALLEVDPDGEAFAEFRKNISKGQPPSSRGKTTTIPTPQEVQEQLQAQKRIKAVELTAKERRRLMREAAARLGSEQSANRVALAGYEEPQAANVADDEDSTAQVAQDLDDSDDQESSKPARSRVNRPKRHVLDDE